eukprot:1161924-Pelagomonas_calceolata.AAC.3
MQLPMTTRVCSPKLAARLKDSKERNQIKSCQCNEPNGVFASCKDMARKLYPRQALAVLYLMIEAAPQDVRALVLLYQVM